MSKPLPEIDAELAAWLQAQKVFFVATAPLSGTGLINCSPKGGEAFRVLGPKEVAYQDYTGSGAETAAHLRENGRITIMFCAFDGPPDIIRLYGKGELITRGHARFSEFEKVFPKNPGTRSFVRVDLTRVSTSCGYSVPLMDFKAPREQLNKWAANKGEEGVAEYRAQKNRKSIEGLPAFRD